MDFCGSLFLYYSTRQNFYRQVLLRYKFLSYQDKLKFLTNYILYGKIKLTNAIFRAQYTKERKE